MDAMRMAEAQEQALGIFADAVLKLALRIQQRAMDAEDLDQQNRAADAVNKLGRGFRQTVALQAKIARDARREAAQPFVPPDATPGAPAASTPDPAAPEPTVPADLPIPSDPRTVALRRRGDWLTRGVERCVWTEYDREDAGDAFTGDGLLEDLRARLAELMADPEAFLALDPDDLLVELCQDLGVEPPEFHIPAPPAPKAAPVLAGAGPDSS